MEVQSNVEAVNVVIEKLSELVAQNNAVQQDSVSGGNDSNPRLVADLGASGQRETIDTAKHLIEFVRTENPALSFTRTPTKSEENEAFTRHATRSVVRQLQSRNDHFEKTEEEIIVNLPANLGQLNLTNKKTLIESLMNLNASLQEKSEVSNVVVKKGDKEATYKCTKCDYCSRNKYYLKQHVELVHNAERPFKCPFCDYAGKRSHSLKEHLVVHSTNRPYECSLCSATFRKKGHLTNHIKMHANAKNFECNICEDKFGDRYLLYDHLRSTHPSDSYYACDFCEYATTIKSNIIMHMHTHGNPKSYKCDKCPYIALHINIMKEHAVGHGVGSTFHEEAVTKKTKPVILLKCSECGFTTDERSILNDHMLKHISDVNLLASAKSQETNPHDTSTMTPAGKDNDQPTAYVCKECDFMSTEAYVFITHMLSHKAKQGAQVAPTTAGKSPAAAAAAAAATTCSTAKSNTMTSSSSQSLQSASAEPVDMSQPWTHDSSVGLYRCTICGYFTKHQRTIKSHIWKHSGHKDIDYPMFQNGPLSVYDDIPIGKTTLVSNNNVIQMQKDSAKGNKDTKDDGKEEDPVKKSTDVRPGSVTLVKREEVSLSQNMLKTTGRGKKQNLITGMADTQLMGSPVLPNVVQITIPPLGNQKSTGSATGSATSAMTVSNSAVVSTTTSVIGQTTQSVSTQKRPTIQLVDRSQKPKLPVTVLVSKQSSEQKQVILLTTGSGKEKSGEAKFPGKIHKMVPIQRSEGKSRIHIESLSGQSGSRPLMLIQRRNSAPVDEPRQVISIVTSDAENTSAGSGDEILQTNVPGAKRANIVELHAEQHQSSENVANSEMPVDTSIEDTELYEPQNSSQDANQSKDSIGTRLRKRRLGSSPVRGSDAEVPEISGNAAKRVCTEGHDEEGNVIVEKLTPVFSAQPFAISESRGSSPRIPNSPRISEVAIHSDSSTDSSPSTPNATTEVTIVETQVMVMAPAEETVETTHMEYAEEPQVHETQNDEPAMQYEEIVYIEPGSEQVVEMSTTESTTDQTAEFQEVVVQEPLPPDHEQMVTLLSLLKKGSVTNAPVDPPQNSSGPESPRRRTRTRSRTEGNSAPKKGISSHLLAVIEQLREKTGSMSGDEEESLEDEPSEAPRRPNSRRSSAGGSRRGAGNRKVSSPEANVPIECYLNVEAMEDDLGIRYRCKLCHYSSTSTSLMKTHMRLHKAKQPCECSLCEYVAESNESLQDHMLQHCKVRTYQCKLCPSVFNYKSQLRAHMRAHTFACDKCSFETSNPKTLSSHTKSHSKDFYCDHCNEAFISEEALANHSLICNSISIGELWKCRHCDFETENSEQQQEHLLSHAKIYKCETCDYTTQSYINIRNHCRDHEQEKTLKCELCDFIATSTRSLKSHMKRHANDQRFVQQPLEQYKCNLCGYVCHHLPSLKSHMWRHSSDSNYSYMITNDIINAAIDNPNLTDYAEAGKTQEENPKENNSPNTVFNDKTMIQKTMGSTGSLVTFRCCQCGFESTEKSQLNEHMKSHIDIIKKTFEVNKSQLLPGQIRRQISGESDLMDTRRHRLSKDGTSDGDDNPEVHVIVSRS